jgi:hypothetical protein
LLSRKNPGVELSGELLEGAKLQEGDWSFQSECRIPSCGFSSGIPTFLK